MENSNLVNDLPIYDTEKTYITKREKFSYGFAGLGQNMIYGMMSSFLLTFFTDIVFSEAIWMVAVIMIIARVWDAVNDLIMGSIVDRTRTKWGKCRPYLLIAPVPIAVFTILIYFSPETTLFWKTAYALFTYVAWGMIYTMSDVPFWGLPSTMTPNHKERADFLAFAKILGGIGGALPFVAMELFKVNGDYTRKSYMMGAIVMGVVGATLYALAFFNSKERIQPKAEILSIKDNIKLIKQNKPLHRVIIMGVLSFGRYVVGMCLIYATRDVFVGGPKMSMLLYSLAVGLGMFPGMLIMPFLFKKFNYRQIAIGAGLFSLCSELVFFIVAVATGYNYWIALPFVLISGIPFGIYNTLFATLVGDSVDYMEWKTGRRTEGLGFACHTFINKLGAAVATGIIPLLLILVNYVAPEDRTSDYVIPKLGLLIIIVLVPALSMFLSTLPMFNYTFIDEEKDKIMAELEIIRRKENRIVED